MDYHGHNNSQDSCTHCAPATSGQHEHHAHKVEDFKKRFIISLILTIPVLVLSPFIQNVLGLNFDLVGDKYLLFIFSSIIFGYGGWPFLQGMVNEIKDKQPGMMTLIGVAISVAYIYSLLVVFGLQGKFFFWELVTLIDIMLLGHWIEMRSTMGASDALSALAKLVPSKAHLVQKDKANTQDVAISDLKKGDIVLVKPGEKIPVDGLVVKGATTINESMLTGESQPVVKEINSTVIGGSINNEGSIEIQVHKIGKDSYINQVIELVSAAQASKSKTQDLTDRAALWLTIISISAGIITLILWILYAQDFVFALERMVTVMVITCPHALGLAIPLVVAVSTSISAKNGIIIKNRDAFEKIKDIDTVVFDKTGTLTKAEFAVDDIIKLQNFNSDEILILAASLESHSEHPIAKGILKQQQSRKLQLREVKDFRSIPGKGVEGTIDGVTYSAVSPNYLKEIGVTAKDTDVKNLLAQGKTLVFVLKTKQVIGIIALADIVRDESRQAVNKLKQAGIKCIMLTGDNHTVAKTVSEELKLDDYYAEVLPHQKSAIIKKIQSDHSKVAMVGDGVNDAPALAQADVGIAIGAGTDVAIESGDIILTKNNPLDMVTLIQLSKATYNKMLQNLWWATGYNVIAIPLAAGVLSGIGFVLSPAVGAVLMSLSTVIVAINARFLSIKN